MDTDHRQQCVLSHPDHPHFTSTGHVCATCEDKLRNTLRQLPEMYLYLSVELEPGAAAPADGKRHTKADAAPLPVRLDVLNLVERAGFVAGLQDWEADWRDTFGLTAPTFRGSTAQTLVGVVEFLCVWLSKACAVHPAMDEFAREVRHTHSTLRYTLGQRDETFSPGKCALPADVDPDPDTGGVPDCGGRLLMDRYGLSTVRCAKCGEEWPPERWGQLAGELPDPRQASA